MNARILILILGFNSVGFMNAAMDDVIMNNDYLDSSQESYSASELNQIFDIPNHQLEDITTLLQTHYTARELSEWLHANRDYFRQNNYKRGLLHRLINLTPAYSDEKVVCQKVKELVKAGIPINESYKTYRTPLDRLNFLIFQQELKDFHAQAALHGPKITEIDRQTLIGLNSDYKSTIDKLWAMHIVLYSHGGRTTEELLLDACSQSGGCIIL